MTFSKKHFPSPLVAAALAVLLIAGQSPAAAQNLERQNEKSSTTTVRSAQAPIALSGTTPDVRAVSTTYVKTYANFISKTTQQKDLFPDDVQATSDGGYILLATTDCTTQACVSAQGGTNNLVSWLVKTDSLGNPQWQKEVGGSSGYSIGLSLQQTKDGSYIVGGGVVGGGSGTCGGVSSLTCAIAEKFDSKGQLVWGQTYPIGPNGGDITSLKQTADGGYVAAGNSYAPGSAANGALVLKLDGGGHLLWQRVIGPTVSTYASFNAVQQTSDGGYVATGFYGMYSTTVALGVLAAKLDSSGNLQWQQGFNDFGSQSGSASANSIVDTPDGGYLVAGYWVGPGFSPTAGALLLKLDSGGKLQWQKAYSGGTYCYFNGLNDTCVPISALIYSAYQTLDGGYVLAGAGDLELSDSVPQVPWLAKVDASGNLLWQNFYYQVYTTGRPLSQYFASSAPAQDGGFLAVGRTEDYATQLDLLFTAKTDSSGLCGNSCGDVHAATPLTAVDPALTASTLALPVSTTAIPGVRSTSKTKTTAIKVKQDCP